MNDTEEGIIKYGKPLKFHPYVCTPIERIRSCTDVPCLVIFLVFLGGWICIAFYAIIHGDLNKLSVLTDSLNRKCGIDSQVLDKKYLFFFNLEKCFDPFMPITGCPTRQVCVNSCPTETFIWENMRNTLSYEDIKRRLVCITDVDKNNIQNMNDIEIAINETRCANWYMKSAPFLNLCIWKFQQQLSDCTPSNRNISYVNNNNNKNNNNNNNTELQYQMHYQASALTNHKNQSKMELNEESSVQCNELKTTVIEEKMRQTDSLLAKLVGNLIARFYATQHDTQKFVEEIVEDMINSTYLILVAVFFTLIGSLIFIVLMRWLAAYMIWLSMFVVIFGLIVGISFFLHQYNFRESNPMWLYLSLALLVILFIILFFVIVFRKRINIAIALIKESSNAVSSEILTVFFPIFSCILYIALIGNAFSIGLNLLSIGDSSFRMMHLLDGGSCICEGPAINYKLGDYCDPQVFQKNCYTHNGNYHRHLKSSHIPCTHTSCNLDGIFNPWLVKFYFIYFVFGFFWLLFFISAFNDMVLAATFATWYWGYEKRQCLSYSTLVGAIQLTISYHLGTLAYGSLILTICCKIRIVLEYIQTKVKKSDNIVTRTILRYMKYIFWIFEKCLQFLTYNAFIQCAIHGKNFCDSAKDAFNLIMRNFLRTIALNNVTDFLFLLLKILIITTACAGTYYFLISESSVMQMHYIAVPITIVAACAFLITNVFFNVYSIAVDTLFLCFLEDIERNDGTSKKPYFMDENLMRILRQRNNY